MKKVAKKTAKPPKPRTPEQIATAELKTASGVRLKSIRDQRKLTVAQLANRLSDINRPLGESRISNFEQGTRAIGVYEAKSLAAALGITAAHLLCVDDTDVYLADNVKLMAEMYKNLPDADKHGFLTAAQVILSSNRGQKNRTLTEDASPPQAKLRSVINPGKEDIRDANSSEDIEPVSHSKKSSTRTRKSTKVGAKSTRN